jgi:formylmethanofuran dehydrogenase subunit E
MAALTRMDLDTKACGKCGTNHIDHDNEPVLFTSKCHPEAPVQVMYQKGVLIVICNECGEYIASIKVAEP